ncbi:hypothetical protein DEJ13_15300 [Curtobacterium sp. MCLR17_007]|uniref:hypothetical protein n=1 Tax=Curtobacterium sp. MCLR17_007 TaxID=2175648 RepID=UPI000DA79409|nr:hypothetical protein [Curtobacterium sp. MCLR17_007]WIB59789.1 hypothetical protein DEJ13_15300 [Curtobacterium sp. MCLR17_007]
MADAQDALFVRQLRQHATGWQRLGLSAEQSVALEIAVPFVGVELPHLTTDLRWLWVTFTHDGGGFVAECRWGDEKHYDDVGPIDGNLDVLEPAGEHGAERTADRVSQWIVQQAGRIVRRDDWGWPLRLTRWVFLDSGKDLDRSHLVPRAGGRAPVRSSLEGFMAGDDQPPCPEDVSFGS